MLDRDYIIRFQQGDFDAFGKLYERYIDKIYSYVVRKVSAPETAEDIVSQVWMKAMSSLEKFDVEAENMSFQAWIYRIAHNSLVDYYRTKKESVDIEEIIEPGVSEDFIARIDAKDQVKHIVSYIASLGNTEREICVLRLLDDLSYKEIAQLI